MEIDKKSEDYDKELYDEEMDEEQQLKKSN